MTEGFFRAGDCSKCCRRVHFFPPKNSPGRGSDDFSAEATEAQSVEGTFWRSRSRGVCSGPWTLESSLMSRLSVLLREDISGASNPALYGDKTQRGEGTLSSYPGKVVPMD